MVTHSATRIVRAAATAASPEEFAAFLIRQFLLQAPDSGKQILNDGEAKGFLRAIGDEGDLAAGIQYLGDICPHKERRNQLCIFLSCAGIALAAGAFRMSCEFYMEAFKIPIRESDELWWALHAGILGLCIGAARIPPTSFKPFAQDEDAESANLLVQYLATYAKYMHESVEQEVLQPRRDLLETYANASDALFRAVEARPQRAGTMLRLREQIMGRMLEEADRDFFEKNRRDPAEEIGHLVDNWTGGEWDFAKIVHDVNEAWSRAYAQM